MTHHLDQTHILHQLGTFLAGMEESLPNDEGHCNGFILMFMRALSIGQKNVYMKRLKTIASLNKSQLFFLGKLLKHYHKRYHSYHTNKDPQQDIAAALWRSHSMEYRILFDSDFEPFKQKLADAKDFYAFTQSLIFAQDPTLVGLTFSTTKGKISQFDLLEILQVIAPDQSYFNGMLPIKHSFRFSFHFTHNDLIYLLKKIPQGKYVCINTSYSDESCHIIFVMKLFARRNFVKYMIYDSNQSNGVLYCSDAKQLAHFLPSFLTVRNLEKTTPIQFDIYESTYRTIKKHWRLREGKILDALLQSNKGATRSINERNHEDISLLSLATESGHLTLTKALLSRGARIDLHAFRSARTQEIHHLLQQHTGISGRLNRHLPAILLMLLIMMTLNVLPLEKSTSAVIHFALIASLVATLYRFERCPNEKPETLPSFYSHKTTFFGAKKQRASEMVLAKQANDNFNHDQQNNRHFK